MSPLLLVVALGAVSAAAADEDAAARLSEPILLESITDIDGRGAGELELDVLGGVPLAARAGDVWLTQLEVEWRPFERLGIGVEADWSGGWPPQLAGSLITARASASYLLVQDFERELYVQAFASVGVPFEVETGLFDYAAPFVAGLHAATRRGPFCFRAVLAGEAGPSARALSAHLGIAALLELGPKARYGFIGASAVHEGALPSPLVIGPEAAFHATAFGFPLKLGLVVPFRARTNASGFESTAILRAMFDFD